MASGRLTVSCGDNKIAAVCSLTQRQQKILLAGGLLNYTKEGGI
jgi:hypothetical protein